MADPAELGHQLRGLRAAAGRTVASVARDAGLSVPYIANLENGRGNPTVAALDRLATALGAALEVSLVPAGGEASTTATPPSLVRLGRSQRFQREAAGLAAALGANPHEFSVRLIGALAGLADALGVDPGETGWARLLDALLLIVEHPVPATRAYDQLRQGAEPDDPPDARSRRR
jgi:transcriptional regulator with XRE-family HTH domain